MTQYITYFNIVHDYCSKNDGQSYEIEKPKPGSIIYQKIKEYIIRHNNYLKQKGDNLMGESVLNFFSKEWKQYQLSSKVVNGITGYLNRFY